MKQRWIEGNTFNLLENGEAFFPRVFDVISQAREEVLLETFILFDDKVGTALQKALLQAAENGASVDVTIDGWGSYDLSDAYIQTLIAAGVRIHVFDPAPKLFGWRANVFRRMHRKIVVVDGVTAFIGGINYSADHLADYGPEAKQDYSVEIAGPIVADIHRFVHASMKGGKQPRRWFFRRPQMEKISMPAVGDAKALFVWRDNQGHHNDIERQYRLGMRLARERLVIANAYFFPGYFFLKEMRKAAKRGVKVILIVQGKPDMAIVQFGASMLYHYLLRAGVQIFEYCERPLHGKVALVDDQWATIGSSNLDPLSLSLNLEANVVIEDRRFNEQLSASLERLMRECCKEIRAPDLRESPWWRQLRGFFLFHILRRFPSWAGLLPAHVPKIKSLKPLPSEGADRIQEPVSS